MCININFVVMEAIPLNNVIICINRQTITSSSNNDGNGNGGSGNKKLSNVIFHRFNAFWMLSFTQTNRAECQKVKWNANEKLSLSIRHSLTGCLSLSLSLSRTRAHTICIGLEHISVEKSLLRIWYSNLVYNVEGGSRPLLTWQNALHSTTMELF